MRRPICHTITSGYFWITFINQMFVSIHLPKLTSEFTYLSAAIVLLMHDTRYIV